MAEIAELVLAEPAFEESAGVDAGRGVALEVDEVARLVAVAAVKKMVEADFHQRRERGIGRNMAADAVVIFVLVGHHGHGVPAREALDAALERAVAWIGDLLLPDGDVLM